MSSSSLPTKESSTNSLEGGDQPPASTKQLEVGGDESWVSARNDNHLTDEQRFSLFKAKFNKSYASQEEEDFRLEVFRSNMLRAARDQELDPTAIHGVTKFSDLTETEFRKQFLGFQGNPSLEGSKDPIH